MTMLNSNFHSIFCIVSIGLSMAVFQKTHAQVKDTLLLSDCYQLLESNHLVNNRETIAGEKYKLEKSNLKKKWLPEVQLTAKATYQSQVTSIPIEIPGFEIESVSKDQYNIATEISQLIYDGGMTKNMQSLKELEYRLSSKMVDTEIHRLKNYLVNWYFGVLLLDAQLQQLDLISADIDQTINQTKASVEIGVLLRTNLDILTAEKLSLEQQKIQIQGKRRSMLRMISILLSKNLDSEIVLLSPKNVQVLAYNQSLKRPELELFKLKKEVLLSRDKIRDSASKPKVNAFVTGAYGKPALDFLSNSFNDYYLGGIRMYWPLSSFYTKKNDKNLNQLEIENILNEEELFKQNLDLELQQILSDIQNYENIMEIDREILALRMRIKERTQSQYENGIIRASDYLHELHQEEKAAVTLKQHELEWLKAIEEWKNKTGNVQ